MPDFPTRPISVFCTPLISLCNIYRWGCGDMGNNTKTIFKYIIYIKNSFIRLLGGVPPRPTSPAARI